MEQYQTPSWLASEIIYTAYLRGDIEDRAGDFGCGTGRIAIGLALMGCGEVLCIDISCRDLIDALRYSRDLGVRENIDPLCWDLRKGFYGTLDSVFMNPPFGIYRRGIDIEFLRAALRSSATVYSIFYFNIKSIRLLDSVSREYGFTMEIIGKYPMEVPAIYPSHRRRIYRIPVLVARFTHRR